MKSLCLPAVFASISVALTTVNVSADQSDFEHWRRLESAGETEPAGAIVNELRTRGPDALAELLTLRDRLDVRSQGAAFDPAFDSLPDEIADLDRFIDSVGGQRYCSASRLFWHTNLETARRAAAESGKPILSLRLLGNLTDELSCANSRFFRTTLYANADISDYLREHYVLHWESVRPAPVMTVDFGDGRRMIRTVTGNSIHYVLDTEGRPLDGLPGLYGPQPFLEWLRRADALGLAVNRVESTEDRALILSSYHERRLREIEQAWQEDLDVLGLVPESAQARSAPGGRADREAVPAEEAVVRAMTKMAVEVRPIAMITMSRVDLAELTTETVWRDIALLHIEASELDEASRRLIHAEVPALQADLAAVTKSRVERRPLARLFSSLKMSTALDSVRNEYVLHAQVHEWFLGGEVDGDVDALNDRVYSELFLTPGTDPWLGLFDPAVYTGLVNGGIVEVTE